MLLGKGQPKARVNHRYSSSVKSTIYSDGSKFIPFRTRYEIDIFVSKRHR